MRIILPYRSSTFATSGAVKQDLYWRGNGPLDCDGSSGSNDAYGFSTLAKYYANYRCIASSIKLYVWASSDTAGMPVAYKLGPNVSEASAAYGRYNTNKVVMRASNTTSERGKAVVIRNACSTRRMYPYSETPNPNVWALVTAQPNLPWYWYFHVWNVMATGEFNEVTVRAVVSINYYCEFVGRDDTIVEDTETHGITESPATPP